MLAWIVAGAVAWYQAGKEMPELPARVAADTRGWRADSDQVLAYFDDRLVPEADSHILAAELLTDFNGWLAERGHRPWSDKTLAARFAGHTDVVRHHIAKTRVRSSAGRSTRPQMYAVPGAAASSARPHAWVGVRFRTAADDLATPSGPGGPGALVTEKSLSHEALPDVPVHPVHTIGQGRAS